jgi:hypothetical protein
MATRLWIVLSLAALCGLPARAADEGDAKPALPDRRAVVESYSVVKDEKNNRQTLVLHLSYPKPKVSSEFSGQGTFLVTIPNAGLGKYLPRAVNIAEMPVADALLGVSESGADVVVQYRLSWPAKCRAYAVPSERKVVIEADVPTDLPAKPGETAEPGPEPDKADAKLIDIDVTADIKTIITTLVNKTGANVLLQPDVTGTYSIKLAKVTLDQALDALWEAWGLVYIRLPGNIWLIGTEADLGKRRTEDFVKLPAGWSVDDVITVLAAEFPDVALGIDRKNIPAGGPIPIRGPAGDTGKARRWVAKLPPKDPGTPPVGAMASVLGDSSQYYPRNLSLEAAADKLKAIFPQLSIATDRDLGRLTISGPRDTVVSARKYLDSVDQPTNK